MTSESEMNPVDEQNPKKGRHRKKQLYNSILQQMEFYFSDSNLAKDRLLSQLVKENPNVDLDVFLKFNKIRKLTTNVEDIRKAIKTSTIIELNDDKMSVHRKVPIVVKDNVDDCTIYVEGLKSDANHDWVKSIFNEFGNVVYISLPKYKNRNTIKGFAFIEYENEQGAQNALNYFESIGAKMCSTTTEPSKLCSIATYEAENNDSNDDGNKIDENSTKKRKLDDGDLDTQDNDQTKRIKIETEVIESDSEAKRIKIEAEVIESDSEAKKKKKQHKKETKKRNFIKELGLRVLSKKDWKKMRNRYLELQKKKMKEFKQHLHRIKHSQNNYDDNKPKITSDDNEEKKADSKPEFVEGVIVKIKLPEPCTDIKKLKSEIRTNYTEVKFVDIPLTVNTDEVFVRFGERKYAEEFCKQEFNGEKSILQGDEEKAYWDKLIEMREKTFKKSVKKQRGRDKLRKKANKIMATHIKFDD